MIKRCVEVSGGPAHLSVKNSQLVLTREGREISQIPIEDLGVLVIDNPSITYTHAALATMVEQNVAVVVCGGNHHPAGLLLPIEGHTLHGATVTMQSSTVKRVKDRLWKEIIAAKLKNQAYAVKLTGKEGSGLEALSRRVKSGDPENLEAQAAQRYWPMLFGPAFRRSRDGGPPNNLLNYGYIVLRAATARAVCGAGLHPSLGIHHRNQYNAFALADDLMEPVRPLVDIAVYKLWNEGKTEICREGKEKLLGVLASSVEINGQNSPLMTALQKSAASLREALAGESNGLNIPKPLSLHLQDRED